MRGWAACSMALPSYSMQESSLGLPSAPRPALLWIPEVFTHVYHSLGYVVCVPQLAPCLTISTVLGTEKEPNNMSSG